MPARDRIERIVAQRLIECVTHIHPPDVTVAGPAQIIGANAVLKNAVIHHYANRGRARQEPIVIEVNGGIVSVVMETEFCGVAFEKRILNVDVSDINLLMARIEGVQTAVRVFFQKIKVRQVVIDPVRTQISEKPHSRLLFRENKSAKIAHELLNSCADRNEIKIRTQIVNLGLDKTFLQASVRVETIGPVANVNVDQSALAGLQKIEIEFWREANAEINWPKTGVAFEKIERQTKTLRSEALFSAAEEVGAIGLFGGNTAWDG